MVRIVLHTDTRRKGVQQALQSRTPKGTPAQAAQTAWPPMGPSSGPYVVLRCYMSLSYTIRSHCCLHWVGFTLSWLALLVMVCHWLLLRCIPPVPRSSEASMLLLGWGFSAGGVGPAGQLLAACVMLRQRGGTLPGARETCTCACTDLFGCV